MATATKEKPHPLIRRAKRRVVFLAILVVLAVGLLFLAQSRLDELEFKLGAALQELEHVEISTVEIEEKLSLISELATSSFEYTNQKTITNTRQILGIDIPGTTNSVTITYDGIIKVGYDISALRYTVDESSLEIRFKLPEAQVLDNYIILDTLQCNDKNNLFNPIGSDTIAEYFADIQKEELERATERGIFTEAEEQLKSIIINYFAAFPDYTIVFE